MNDNSRNGPENAPLRDYVTSYPIVVTIYDVKGNIVREEKMNYGKFEDKKWLGRLSWWAWEQGYSVETYPDK